MPEARPGPEALAMPDIPALLSSPSTFPELDASASSASRSGGDLARPRPRPRVRSRIPSGRGSIRHAAFVAAVSLMASLGTGIWDTPSSASSPSALVRAAAHLPAQELPVVPGPSIPTAIVNVPPPAARARPAGATTRRATAPVARQATAPAPDPSVSAFVPLYQLAGQTFGVNWMLIAAIHDQETSFSRDPTTYHGLNSAGCCGGPMQFNVTNGPVSTWSLVSDAYRYATRPAGYPHETQSHPSIYDDFDAIMAAGRLLQSNGATPDLGAASWGAAYSYYGHDAFGVTYADQVLARAIMWSQQGFCPDCSVDPALVSAVHAAYAPGGSGHLASLGAAASAPAPARTPAQAATPRGRTHRPAHHTSTHRSSARRPPHRPSPHHPTHRRPTRRSPQRPAPRPHVRTHGVSGHSSGGAAFRAPAGTAGGAPAA